MRKLNPVAAGLVLWAVQMLPALAQTSPAERNVAEFKALPLERQKAILFIESFEALNGLISLFDCALEVPRAARNIRERMKQGLNVGSSSTQT